MIVRLESTHVSFAEAFSLLSVSPSEVILDVCVHEMKLLWGEISLNDCWKDLCNHESTSE